MIRITRPAALALGLLVAVPAAAQVGPDRKSEFPESVYFPRRPAALVAMEGKPAPALDLKDWIGEPQNLADLEGKVVIVDFWATWCGPCMRAIPHNIELVKKHGDDLVIIGVHDAKRGTERIEAVVRDLEINYPVATDAGPSQTAWNIAFWPTYAAIDRKGIVRAIGLQPSGVDTVVEVLLAEGDSSLDDAPAANGIPAEWLEQGRDQRERLRGLEARASSPPPIRSSEWINSPALELADLKGKVVMIDFWATWCGTCIAAVPHTNELQAKYADDGLVIIGVCHKNGVEKMAQTVEERGILYPVCADDGTMLEAYAADGFPDYYFIDRSGTLRIADCKNARIDDAIKLLLAED